MKVMNIKSSYILIHKYIKLIDISIKDLNWVLGASTNVMVFEFIDLNDEKCWSCKEEHERNVWQRSKEKD